MDELRDAIINEIFKDFKDDIIQNESLEHFLNSFTHKKLLDVIKLSSIVNDDKVLLSKSLSLGTTKKNKTVEYMVENYEEIYNSMLKIFNDDFYFLMKKYIKECSNGYLKLYLYDMEYSLGFIMKIREFKIGKVNCNKNEIDIYIPKEILKIISNIINDKSIMKKIKRNTKIRYNIDSLISTYGVLKLEKLHEIYGNTFLNISIEEMLNIIMLSVIINSEVNILEYDEEYYIYSSSFEDEDSALDFYESLDDKIDYKMFSKKDLNALSEGDYYCKSSSYVDLMDFLYDMFNFEEDGIEEFERLYILDYMFSFRIDEQEAKTKLNNNLIKKILDIDLVDRAIILKKVNNVAKDYPLYKYKGYSKNEIEK